MTSAQSEKADTVTLLQAIQTGGGGLAALGRHAAAALANADSGINYAYTLAQVVGIYKDAVGAIAGPETVDSAIAKLALAEDNDGPDDEHEPHGAGVLCPLN